MARKATDGATGVVRTTVLLTPEQKAKKLPAIGGSATVRRLIDEAYASLPKAQRAASRSRKDIEG